MAASGCNVDPYTLGSDGGVGPGGGDGGGMGGDGGGGGGDGGGGMPDASLPDACVPASESCNEADDDCDGEIDEDFDLTSDPGNCGSCGNACSEPGAAGSCEAGECSFTCLPNFHDLDGDLGTGGGDGCEYGPCTITGDEICDGEDNDCDDAIDENVAGLDSDPDNCGACFNQCIFVNVENATCSGGECGYDACLDDDGDGVADYADVTNPPAGCEYECPVSPPLAQEQCNALDDDCDGVVDELPIAGLGDPCYPSGQPGCTDNGDGTFTCSGICESGVIACNFGVEVCQGFTTPENQEVCDSVDRDCDGDPRNGFDTQNDPNHCGDSCVTCDLANAVPACSNGTCVVSDCLAGFENPDGIDSNGCEYACTKTGDELCDGKDNDCDTKIDEGLTPPAALDCSLAGTPCANVEPTCSECNGSTTWRCDYSGVSDVETTTCGELVFEESQCDATDNDCDGFVDESFPVTQTCDDGEIGACKDTGEFICDPSDETNVVCDFTDTLSPPGNAETCNDEDDDCDGQVDEDAPNELVDIDDDGDGTIDYSIFAYEASRPDADLNAVGAAGHRACSEPDRMPWRSVTWTEAAAACDAAFGTVGDGVGRLCSATEWERACGGASGLRYPYGDTYDGGACNGHDFDLDCTPPNDNEELLPTGYDYQCPLPNDGIPNTCQLQEPGLDALDMSGNLKEWTATEEPAGSGFFQVRGGSYDNVAEGLTCENDFLSFEQSTAFPNLGFRCCVDGP